MKCSTNTQKILFIEKYRKIRANQPIFATRVNTEVQVRRVTRSDVTMVSRAYTSDFIFSKLQFQSFTKRLTFVRSNFHCNRLTQNYSTTLFRVFVDYYSYMPNRNVNDINNLDSSLKKLLESNTCKHILLAGDFNCPDIDWNTLSVQTALTSTPNLCFRAKIRKNNAYPCRPQYSLYKSGVQGGINHMDEILYAYAVYCDLSGFQMKTVMFFLTSVKIDCGYSLELSL